MQLPAGVTCPSSAGDPDRGANIALLDPKGFAERTPRTGKTWHIRVEGATLIALAAFPSEQQLRFSPDQFGLA